MNFLLWQPTTFLLKSFGIKSSVGLFFVLLFVLTFANYHGNKELFAVVSILTIYYSAGIFFNVFKEINELESILNSVQSDNNAEQQEMATEEIAIQVEIVVEGARANAEIADQSDKLAYHFKNLTQ